ncbi:MAG: NTP transferase domain-containing protein, partial [Syntrophobacteraceae bacterium]|nr:NTP transferase domain-containing protein [Syntrophobacteraceae bacterium]
MRQVRILLGAGESKRMGVDKLSLLWGRETVLEHCLETFLKSDVNEVIVVLGPKDQMLKGLFK